MGCGSPRGGRDPPGGRDPCTFVQRGIVCAFSHATRPAATETTIATRGKSAVGDKTVLDALVPSLDAAETALADGGSGALPAAVTAARDGVEASANLVSRRGRAAWVGERGQGSRDGGAVAWLRLLEAMAAVAAG